MGGFSDRVGVRFRDVATGYVVDGARDPAEAEAADRGRRRAFGFDLEMAVPSLQAFLGASEHAADVVGGRVEWEGHGDLTVVPAPRGLVMFRPGADPATGRAERHFDLRFRYRDAAGSEVEVRGHKLLRDDRGPDALLDLSTVTVLLLRGAEVFASGTVTADLGELLRQVVSVEVTGEDGPKEHAAALREFLAFNNRHWAAVYPAIPLLAVGEGRLNGFETHAVRACARAFLPDDAPPGAVDQVVEQVEGFLGNARSPRAPQIRATIFALLALVLPLLDRDRKRVKQWATRVLETSRDPLARQAIELAHRLAVFPYYAHPARDARVGYRRPSRLDPRRQSRLEVASAGDDAVFGRRYGVVIAGSGPAGSLLAERLSRAGRTVLVLEAGPYVREADLAAPGPSGVPVASDELASTARLYKDAGLQYANGSIGSPSLKRTGPISVLQGACVGGGAVVNNAVCLRLPVARYRHWRDALGFPVSLPALTQAYDRVARDLDIVPLSQAVGAGSPERVNPASRCVQARFGAARVPHVDAPPAPGFFECLVNLERRVDLPDGTPEHPARGCLGCGLCNTLCASERKQNPLQVYLPRAVSTGACTVVAGAEVEGIEVDPGDPSRVVGLRVRRADGSRMVARGEDFVLSGGAVGSSVLLLRAMTADRALRRHISDLPIGRRFCANVGSPAFAFFDGPLHDRPSVQIGHYFLPEGGDFVVETWFSPPGNHALALPGHFETHAARMRRYASTASVGVLIGTNGGGEVRLSSAAARIELPLDPDELRRLQVGLSTAAEALLEGGDGLRPDHVLIALGEGAEVRTAQDVAAFRHRPRADMERLRLSTAHPQGGNAMSDGPLGVVDASFRVKGMSNLRVCDGSVFPGSAGVNPQWTVMALAHLCAEGMGG